MFQLFGPEEHNGLLVDDGEGTLIYGFKNGGDTRQISVPAEKGGCYGYVHSGDLTFNGWNVRAGQWFSTAEGLEATMYPNTHFALWQRQGYFGLNLVGEVEDEGRLNYISNCKDSMLAPPILNGYPCLNALYMPSGVNQQEHTHPSTRSGFIIVGGAKCETPDGVYDLESGQIFYLKTDGLHKFRSDHADDIRMKLVAYHPDSDVGPEHTDHPMLNRTIVEGVSAKEIEKIQTK